MNAKEYIQYRVEDWVQDPSFRSYILDNDPVHERLWEELSTENDDVARKIQEATEILRAMSGLHKSYYEEGVKRSEESLGQLEQRILARKKRSNRRIIAMISAAASIVIAVFVLRLMMTSPQPSEFITTANETEEIVLPDGSIVYLNENSSLTIDDKWEKGIREVALDGEGYFMVRSQVNRSGDKTKFTVKTGGLDIEVLGTQFNVHIRDTMTSIALDEGSIKLIKEQVEKEDSKKESFMVPGEVASFNKRSREIRITEKALTSADTYWKPETIEFNQIKLSDAIAKMETVFGIPFKTDNKKILDLKIDKLSVPSDNPDVFVNTVNILFADKIVIALDPETNTYRIRQINRSIDQ